MSNKRQLKKRIYSICGDLASDAIIASVLFKEVDRERINEIVNDIAELQGDAISKVSFSFDKAPRDFENRAEYRKARHKYYAAAYARLNKQFLDRAIEIVKLLNDVVPEDARKIVSTL